MPDVVTILTKDPKSVPTTAAWLAALAAVMALAALAEEDNRGAPAAAPRREAPAAAADDPAATRAEGTVALKVGDAVTFAFPDTSANTPLTGKRGVVEALPGGGDFPDRYVVFLAATADSGQRRLAVKREHLEFFARGL